MAHQFSFHLLFADHSQPELLVQSEAVEGPNNTTTFKLPIIFVSVTKERATTYEAFHPSIAEVNILPSDSIQAEIDEIT